MAKKVSKKVCSVCINEFSSKDLLWAEKYMFEQHKESGKYNYPVCIKCADKDPQIEVVSSFIRGKNVKNLDIDIRDIDFSKCIKGTPSKNGSERYKFFNDKGKEVTLVLETGLKRGYKLVTKE